MRPYPVIDPQATGENILRRRLEMGYTVPEVQEYLGFATVQAIYHWQRGQNLPSLENMYALSVLLETTVNELVAEVPCPLFERAGGCPDASDTPDALS